MNCHVVHVCVLHELPCLCAQSCLTLCNLWTVAHQAPLSMEFSRLEYWNGLPFPSPGDLLNPGTEPASRLLPGSIPSRIQGYPQDDRIGERIAKWREQRLDLPWLTQKANKAPGTELALFTEATGALSVGWGCRMPAPWWRCRAPSQSGLRSPGKKMNSESHCAPRSHPERRTEREKERKEKKNDTGRPSFSERSP